MATYTSIIRCKWLGDGAKTILEIAEKLEEEAKFLREMHKDGVWLKGAMEDDYAFVTTEDSVLAEKYDLHEEDEYDEECDTVPPPDN